MRGCCKAFRRGAVRPGLELVRAWLCGMHLPRTERAASAASCHAIEVRTHADLCVLMPEVQMMELGWPLSEKAQGQSTTERQTSREIAWVAMRDAVEFSAYCSPEGAARRCWFTLQSKMNHVCGQQLLKTRYAGRRRVPFCKRCSECCAPVAHHSHAPLPGPIP